MRLQLNAQRPHVLAACSIASLLCVAPARADEASGDWSGTVEGRGNYYWETSTRVLVPDVRLQVEAPNGLRVGAGYLVDAISSASIAQGSTEDAVHTEFRHGGEVLVGKELDLDGAYLDLSGRGSYSTEDDYDSIIGSVTGGLSLDQRTTDLSLSVAVVHDEIRANNDATFEGQLDGVTLGVGYNHALTPTLTLGLGYQLAYLEGFLGNAYRQVYFENGAPPRENPPKTRYRHNGVLRLKLHIPVTDTSVQLYYRAYLDSWDIAALTPELRLYQHLGRNVVVRAEYRFYSQTRASFVQPDGIYPGPSASYEGPTSSDPKLDEIVTHTMTAGAEFQTAFFEGTLLDFAKEAWIDFQISRYLSTSSFGNGVIASLGGRLPF